MNLGLDGKIALVTGGARGIGAGIVGALQAEGAHVVYTTRYAPTLSDGIQWDTQDAIELVLRIRERFDGRAPDIVVNNNGHTLGITDPHCDASDWQDVIDVNFGCAVRVSSACIPYMREREWGRIVNITSVAGLENSGPVTYCVAKAALTAYTHCMGRVLATESPGIVMSAVYPSVIKTEGGHWDRADPEHTIAYLNTRVPTKRFQTVDEFAGVVAFYCSEQASACHGAIVGADQGQSKNYSAHNYL